MATIHHRTIHETADLAPGQTGGVQFGPYDELRTGAVSVSCCPSTMADGGGQRTQAIIVSDVNITNVAVKDGDLWITSPYVSFVILNSGDNTIHSFTVNIVIITE